MIQPDDIIICMSDRVHLYARMLHINKKIFRSLFVLILCIYMFKKIVTW